MLDPKAAVQAAIRYIQQHPGILVKYAVNAAGLKVTIPLDVLRYAVKQLKGKNAPKDVVFEAFSPSLRAAATVDAMGTPLRAEAKIKIDSIDATLEQVKIEIRLSDVKLKLEAESDAPVAVLIKSGALDLSKPGNLVKFIPKRPKAIIEAGDDRIVLDLMKEEKFANNPDVKHLLAIITPSLAIRSLVAEDDAIVIAFRPRIDGVKSSFEAARSFIQERRKGRSR
ncbi:MAG: hypothetical protein U0165_11640 [Polyangiaceae bacterium]